jgi:acyl-CoA oxidase
LIGFSHAGITAEGDNRVLFQKAAKELIASMNTKTVQDRLRQGSRPPKITSQGSLTSLTTLRLLYVVRETRKLQHIAGIMAGIGKSQPDIFDAWMYHESDAVQGCTQAFGEREVLDACIRTYENSSGDLKSILYDITLLFALKRMEDDLSWFICQDLVPKNIASHVPETVRQLCAKISQQWQVIIESFGIPEGLIQAPIAGDWTRYNLADNAGEVIDMEF